MFEKPNRSSFTFTFARPTPSLSQVKSLLASEHKLALSLNTAGLKSDAVRVLRRVKVLQEEVASFTAEAPAE